MNGTHTAAQRRCGRCREMLPVVEFARHGAGHQSYCRPCCAETNRAWRLAEWQRTLLKAADYMDVNGKSDGGFSIAAKCALVTIAHVSGEGVRGYYSEAVTRFRIRCIDLGYEDISDFNSRHTKDEVVAKLRAVALGL